MGHLMDLLKHNKVMQVLLNTLLGHTMVRTSTEDPFKQANQSTTTYRAREVTPPGPQSQAETVTPQWTFTSRVTPPTHPTRHLDQQVMKHHLVEHL